MCSIELTRKTFLSTIWILVDINDREVKRLKKQVMCIYAYVCKAEIFEDVDTGTCKQEWKMKKESELFAKREFCCPKRQSQN